MVNKCVGCMSCVSSCKVGAIHKIVSDDGFVYPEVDKSICVHCGLCDSNCIAINPVKAQYPSKTYVAIAKNKKDIEKSSSGGMFWVFAKHFIDNGGYVCGCVFDDNYNAVHIISDKIEDVMRMQGSKYVQSSMCGVFEKISEICKINKKLLFTGTPCQCAAVKQYFKGCSNIFYIDIICHGVPSNKLWQKNLEEMYKINPRKIEFRIKNKYERTRYAFNIDERKKIDYRKNGYYSLFMNEKNFRKSCYHCQFAIPERVGDLTMGDCNTWMDYFDFYPEYPISSLMLNTESGLRLFDEVKDKLEYKVLDYNKEQIGNKQLSRPADVKNRLSDTDLQSLTFGKANLSEYKIGMKFKDYIKLFLKHIFPTKFRYRLQGKFK